jgi:UDP-glucuronate 4-epimerase
MAEPGKIQGRRVLVTGAAGFIGSHLCERLVAEGHGVWGIDNFDPYYDPAIKRRNVRKLVRHPCMHLVEGDIRDEILLDGLFDSVPFDMVVHLAARAGVRASLAQPELCIDVNVTGTLRLLEAMRRHHVTRLVFASSSSVYGERTAAGGAFKETDPAGHPVSPYAASKRTGELLCHTWHHLWGLSAHCLRFFTVYGPRQRPDLAINKFVRLMKEGRSIPMFGDGTTGRDYTFVGDIVEGVSRSMGRLEQRAAADPAFEILNVGRGDVVRLNELIDALSNALGVEAKIARQPEQPGDVPLTLADTEACERVLDWKPGIGIEEGIRKYVAWLEELDTADTVTSGASSP